MELNGFFKRSETRVFLKLSISLKKRLYRIEPLYQAQEYFLKYILVKKGFNDHILNKEAY